VAALRPGCTDGFFARYKAENELAWAVVLCNSNPFLEVSVEGMVAMFTTNLGHLLRASSVVRYRQSVSAAGLRPRAIRMAITVYAQSTANPAHPGSGKYPADGA
jgi:hypothetical protein